MSDELLLAYCAGVVDSDGCIGIKRSTYGMRHGNGGGATFSERVCVKQVEPEAVDLLARLEDGPEQTEMFPAVAGTGDEA